MRKFLSFVKIEHTLFSLPLIYGGMVLALQADKIAGSPRPATGELIAKGLLILGAATGARTVGFALNRIVDRHIDAKNPRTAIRDLPAGRMSLKEAYGVMLAGLLLFFGFTSQINTLCLELSPIPLIVFVIYPYLKRFTSLAHFGVGAFLGLGCLGGYFAVRPTLDHAEAAILLACFTMLWGSGFDIIYATADEQFDKQEGLYSLPSRFGSKRALQISGLIHVLAFLLLVAVYFVAFSGSFVVLAPLLVAGLLLYLEQKKATDVELAFFKINAVLGFVVLLFVIVGVSLT